MQSGSLSLGVTQGIKLESLWQEKVKSLTQGRSETVQGFTVNVIFSQETPTWLVRLQLQPPPFCPAQPQMKLFPSEQGWSQSLPLRPH